MQTSVMFSNVSLGKLVESAANPRKTFDQAKLEELAASIRQLGVQSPLLLRPMKGGKPWIDVNGDSLLDADAYEIGAGHRRYRAAKLAGIELVPAVIRPMTDDEFLDVLTFENLNREDIHAIEEAVGFRELLKRPGYDATVIASKIGKDASYVQKRLKLLALIPDAAKAFREDQVNIPMALILARLTPADQKSALGRIQTPNNWNKIHSSRELQEWVSRELMMNLDSVAFPKDDAELVPAAGACTNCPKRTGFLPELFAEIKSKNTCTDRTCFEKKKSAHALVQIKKLTAEGKGVAPVLVSTDYEESGSAKRVEGQQVFGRGQFEEVTKRNSCPSVTAAVVVRGSEKVGAVLQVCVNASCKVHRPRGSAATPVDKAKQVREEARRKLDAAIRRRSEQEVVRLILAKVDFRNLSKCEPELRSIVRACALEICEEDAVERRGGEDNIEKWIDAAKGPELLTFMYETALQYCGGGEDWEKAAVRLKINVAKVKSDIVATLKAEQKAAEKPAAAKPAAAKAAAKLKKKSVKPAAKKPAK